MEMGQRKVTSSAAEVDERRRMAEKHVRESTRS